MVPAAEGRAEFPAAEEQARVERAPAAVEVALVRPASAEVYGTLGAARARGAVVDLAPGVGPAEAAQEAVGVAVLAVEAALEAEREAVLDLVLEARGAEVVSDRAAQVAEVDLVQVVREARVAELGRVPAVRAAAVVPAEVPEPVVRADQEAVALDLAGAVEAVSGEEVDRVSVQEWVAEREVAEVTLPVAPAAQVLRAEAAEAQARAEQVPVAGRVRAARVPAEAAELEALAPAEARVLGGPPEEEAERSRESG